MNHDTHAVSHSSNRELLAGLQSLACNGRKLGAQLLLHLGLGEVDARRLYAVQAYPSMFEYAVEALHMLESEAYLRIHAARLGRKFPLVLELLESGAVTLTTIKLLGRHLTSDNHAQLLERASGKRKREVERMVAELEPKPDVPSGMRKLPEPRQVQLSAAPCVAAESAPKPEPTTFELQAPRARASCLPLSPSRYRLQITVGQETHDELEQLRDLLRHRVPDGDLARVFELAVHALHEQIMRQRFAQRTTVERAASQEQRADSSAAAVKACVTPGSHAQLELVAASPARPPTDNKPSRYVPRAVVRAVHARDGGQCTFVGPEGQRCTARGFVELHHHDIAYARGGSATVENLRLMCRTHNALLAARDFGAGFMLRRVQQRDSVQAGVMAPRA